VPPTKLAVDYDASCPQLINTAACDPHTLLRLLKPILHKSEIADTDTLVGSAGSQVLTIFSGIPSHSEPLNIEISNYESFPDARNAYIEQKDTLQTILPPDSFLPTPSLGDAAIRTPYSVTWRRNSVVLRAFTAATPTSDADAISPFLLRIARLLDQHIASHSVSSGNEARPAPTLRGEPAISVPVNSSFEVHLDDLDNTHAVKIAEVDDHKIVLPTALGASDGKFTFHALESGRTTVRLCVKHVKNITVSATEVVVTVTGKQDDENGDSDDNGDNDDKGDNGDNDDNVVGTSPRDSHAY
jgi:hypothetical protein